MFCSINHLLNTNAEQSKIENIFFKDKPALLDINLPKLRFKMLIKKIETMAVDMFLCRENKLMIVFLFYVAITKTLLNRNKEKQKLTYKMGESQFSH